MAPSRALLRRITSTCTRANTRTIYSPTSCALSIHTIGAQQKHSHQSALRPTSIRHTAIRTTQCARTYSSPAVAAPEPPDYLNEAELHIFNKIKGELEPVKLEVQDISGGCGSMYAIEIESSRFAGLTVIKQHKLVNQVLKEEIAGWHGVQLRTKAA